MELLKALGMMFGLTAIITGGAFIVAYTIQFFLAHPPMGALVLFLSVSAGLINHYLKEADIHFHIPFVSHAH